MEHTKGPWRLAYDGIAYDGSKAVIDPQNSEGNANAKLIAAAPDLLEACVVIRGLLTGIDHAHYATNTEPEFEKAIEFIDKAIARAREGE